MKRKGLVIGGILVALAGGGAALALRGHHSRQAAGDTAKVARGEIAVVVSETGTVSPRTQVDVKSRVAGLVSKLLVDVGDHVTAGQVLLTLDTTDYQRQLAQAQADRAVAAASLAKLINGPLPEERTEARA